MTKLTKKADNIYGTTTTVTYDSRYLGLRTVSIGFRADSRDGNGYRVDMMTLGPWTAIDDGTPVRTLREANALIRRYIAAVRSSGDLTPPSDSYLAA